MVIACGLVCAAAFASAPVAFAAPGMAFSQVAGSPFAVGGTAPASLAFSPDGTLLVAANSTSNTVTVSSVATSGVLSQLGAPTPTGVTPLSVAFNHDGTLLAVANSGSNTVSVFTVSTGGSLAPVAGSPFATGGVGPRTVAFSPTGGLLVAGNFGSHCFRCSRSTEAAC